MLRAEGLTPAKTGRREKGSVWNQEQFNGARNNARAFKKKKKSLMLILFNNSYCLPPLCQKLCCMQDI